MNKRHPQMYINMPVAVYLDGHIYMPVAGKGIYKERVPVDEVCEHIPENYFKHPIAVHRSINSYNRKFVKNIYNFRLCTQF